MDFAIIGHPKCGTSFLLHKWLCGHPEISMPDHETRVLSGSTGAVQMVRALYKLPPSPNVKRGYKSPAHILRRWALAHFENYWPQSKLIIGIRHPVLWFESFYNYRLKHGVPMPPPAYLMEACTDEMNDVCTAHANFHAHLAMLGKTNLTTSERALFSTQRLVPRGRNHQLHLTNPVFLYDVSQLDGSDPDQSQTVRRDMQDYLGLQQPLPVLEPAAADASKNVAPKAHTMNMTMNICLPEHQELRTHLMQIAWQASEWITTYFLPLPDVTVPAPDHFRALLLDEWRRDPCEKKERQGGADRDHVE
jgi:hypothetical protein